MRVSEHFRVIFVITSLLVGNPAVAQKQLAQSPRILSAKSVYFNNQTGSDAVGKNAPAQLKKWGKFQLIADPKLADLIFLLSADPYKGGNIILASGQTGSINDGHISEDPAIPRRSVEGHAAILRSAGMASLPATDTRA